MILALKNDDYYAKDYMKDLWIKTCEQYLDFYENGDIISFSAVYTSLTAKRKIDGIITNVPHVTKIPSSPILKHLTRELNESYEAIKNLKENLEEL